MTGIDPSAWMERLQQGDREALEPLLAHYEGMLRYIVSGVLSDPHQQEDCLAEVRLKLWEKREQYDPELPGSPCCAGTPPWTT